VHRKVAQNIFDRGKLDIYRNRYGMLLTEIAKVDSVLEGKRTFRWVLLLSAMRHLRFPSETREQLLNVVNSDRLGTTKRRLRKISLRLGYQHSPRRKQTGVKRNDN
jgi:hypothetical protein